MDTEQQIRGPISLLVLLDGECFCCAGGGGGNIVLLGPCASFLLITRLSDKLAESAEAVHPVYCSRRSDLAFFRGEGSGGILGLIPS